MILKYRETILQTIKLITPTITPKNIPRIYIINAAAITKSAMHHLKKTVFIMLPIIKLNKLGNMILCQAFPKFQNTN